MLSLVDSTICHKCILCHLQQTAIFAINAFYAIFSRQYFLPYMHFMSSFVDSNICCYMHFMPSSVDSNTCCNMHFMLSSVDNICHICSLCYLQQIAIFAICVNMLSSVDMNINYICILCYLQQTAIFAIYAFYVIFSRQLFATYIFYAIFSRQQYLLYMHAMLHLQQSAIRLAIYACYAIFSRQQYKYVFKNAACRAYSTVYFMSNFLRIDTLKLWQFMLFSVDYVLNIHFILCYLQQIAIFTILACTLYQSSNLYILCCLQQI